MSSKTYRVDAFLTATDRSFSRVFSQAEKTLNSFDSSIQKFNSGFSNAFFDIGKKAMLAMGTIGTAVGGMAVKNAGEAKAMESQFNQVFSGMENEAKKSLNSISKEASILPDRIKGSFSQIAAFAKVAGMDTAQSLSFAERATRATADAAAFLDMEVGQATETLKSYLKGNFNVADSLGILSTETTRNAKATELFGKKYKDLEGLQQQEVLLSMFEDANKVSGAFGQAAREADGYENVLGNLKQAHKGLSAALGNLFFEPAIAGMKAMTTGAVVLTDKINAFASQFNSLDSASAKINLLKETLSPIAPLLATIASGFTLASAVPAINALPGLFTKSKEKMAAFKKVVDGFPTSMGKWQNAIKGTAGVMSQLIPNSVIGQISGVKSQITGVFDSLPPSIQKTSSAVSSASSNIISGMGTFTSTIMKIIGPAAIIGLALAGLGVLQGQFGEQINQFVNIATTKGPQIITELVKGIVSQIPQLINQGTQLVQQFATVITANAPAVFQGAVDIISALINGISSNASSLISSAIEIIGALVNGLATAIPQLLEVGMQLLLSLAQGIVENLPKLLSLGQNAVSNFISGLSEKLPTILSTAVSIIVTLISGFLQNLPQIVSTGISMINSFIQGLLRALPQVVMAGIKLIVQLIAAIIQNIPQIIQAGWELIKGLGQGMLEAIPSILTGVWDSIKQGFSDLWGWITGKNDEGSAQTQATFDTMSTNVQAATSTMATVSAANVSTMAGSISADMALMNEGATIASSSMNSSVSGDFSMMASNAEGSVASLQASTATAFATANQSAAVDTTSMYSSVNSNYSNAQSTAQSTMSSIEKTTSSSMSNAANSTTQAMNTMNNAVNSGMSGASNKVNSEMEAINNSVQKTSSQMTNTFNKFYEALQNSTTSALNNVKNSFNSSMNEVVNLSNNATNNIGNIFQNLAGQMQSAGYNSGIGFYNGLAGTAGSIYSLAQSIANNVAATIRSALSIHSPSRVTEKLGGFTGEGVEVGLLGSVSNIMKAAKSVALAAVPDIPQNNIFDRFNGVKSRLSLKEVTDFGDLGSSNQPLEIHFSLGNRDFTALVDDITNMQNKKERIRLKTV